MQYSLSLSPPISGRPPPATPVAAAEKLFRRSFLVSFKKLPRHPIYPTIYTTRPHSRFFPPPPAATAAATPSSYTTATPSPTPSSSSSFHHHHHHLTSPITTTSQPPPRGWGVRGFVVGSRRGAAAATTGRIWRAAAAIGHHTGLRWVAATALRGVCWLWVSPQRGPFGL
ncbi:hypothetical protein Tco_1492767 [Tanacetum coccineum]